MTVPAPRPAPPRTAGASWALPGSRGYVTGDPSGLTKLSWLRNPGVPAGQPALGRFECPCGATISDVQFGGPDDYPCACGRVWDSHGWLIESPQATP
jgi:hypothetical protein